MINKATALAFNNNVSDGFIQPTLAWSATTPEHANEVGGDCMTSNFWIGKPEYVKPFAEKIAKFYQEFCNTPDNFDDELEDYESISVAYWEKDGIAMCAELCTSDQLYAQLPTEFFKEAEEKMKHVLFDGNDNDPSEMLKELSRQEPSSVEEIISFAVFMREDSTVWVTEDTYRKDYLPNFSDDDIIRIKAALQK